MAIVAGVGGVLGHATAATLTARGLTVVAVDRNEHAQRELPDHVRREMAAYSVSKAALAHLTRIFGYRASPAEDPVERGSAATTRYAAQSATLPAEVVTHAVAPEAIVGLTAFPVSAAAPMSGAILPTYGS